MKRRIFTVLMALVLLAAVMPSWNTKVHASGDVAINSTNFPDAVFRSEVKETFDTNDNDYLSTAEIEAVKKLDVSEEEIKDLTGIEYLYALEKLDFSFNDVTKVELGNLKQLKKLYCDKNSLEKLDISCNTKLTELKCWGNQLTSLNVSKNTKLQEMDAASNLLTSMNLSNNPALEKLDVSGNLLTSLDVSHNPELTDLRVDLNPDLFGLDISQNEYLKIAYLEYNAKYSWDDVIGYAVVGEEEYDEYDEYDDEWDDPEFIYYLQVDSSLSIYEEIDEKPVITKKPVNLEVEEGETAEFDVDGTGMTKVQWQYRTSSDAAWTNVASVEGKKLIYSFTAKARHDGYQYRCRLTNSMGNTYTPARTLSVVTKPTITTQPKDQVVKVGGTASFSVKASGGNLSYQWYYRTSSDADWKAISAASGKTANYSLTAEARHDGYQYRCKVKNTKGSVYTAVRTLSVVTAKPTIKTQPANQYPAEGGKATLAVVAEGKGLSYQWYYRTSSTAEWKAVSSSAGKKASYSFSVEERHDGYQYRCKVTNLMGSVYTGTRTLTIVLEGPTITGQTSSKTVNAGDTVAFSVKASGLGLTYQWYYRKSSSDSWKEVSAESGKTAKYTMTAQARHNGYQYRCKVTNALGVAYSKIMTLTVK